MKDLVKLNIADECIPVQVVVTLWLDADADVNEVISEMDYDFRHSHIVDMEIREINTEI